MTCHKCHQLGHWAALCPGDPRASRSSTKPSLMMVQQDWSGPLQPDGLSLITITGLESRMQLDVAGRSENFLVDTGATYSVLTSYSRAFSSKTCTILVLQEKQLLKDSSKHFFVAGMDKYFPTSFWWSLSILLPYWEETYSLNWGPPLWWKAFQPLEPYSYWLLLKNPLPSPIKREKKNYGKTKLTPRWGTREFLDEPTKLNRSSLSPEIPLGFLTGNNNPSKEQLRRDYSL